MVERTGAAETVEPTWEAGWEVGCWPPLLRMDLVGRSEGRVGERERAVWPAVVDVVEAGAAGVRSDIMMVFIGCLVGLRY